ncbi:MAG TPA: AI-2E family transporter [Nitrospira sp.]|jgi:predicted PurR-regulated permease PerM|nr:AI-2E family transporter [Nitrospira sp.]
MSPQALSTAFLVLCFLVLYQLALIFAPFFTPILWALILARMFYPLYRSLFRLTAGHATVSAAVSTLTVTFVAVLPVAYLLFLVITETIRAYQAGMMWVEGGGLKRLPTLVSALPVIGTISQEVLGRFVVAYGDVQGSLLEGGKAFSAVLLTGASGLAKNTFELVSDFLIMLFTLFFFFRDGHRLFDAFYQAVPLDERHKAAIFDRLHQTMIAVVRGTLLTAMAQGFAAGVTYWALGVPFPVFLGALSALFALLPFGGTALVWGPIAVYLFWTAPLWKMFVMIGVGVGLVGLMDNFLQPLLVGSGADLPVLFLFFASIGGLAYFGFIGLFLGPILLGIAIAAFKIYRDNYQPPGALLTAEETGPPPETPI